mgnify:CR=1 FL=1
MATGHRPPGIDSTRLAPAQCAAIDEAHPRTTSPLGRIIGGEAACPRGSSPVESSRRRSAHGSTCADCRPLLSRSVSGKTEALLDLQRRRATCLAASALLRIWADRIALGVCRAGDVGASESHRGAGGAIGGRPAALHVPGLTGTGCVDPDAGARATVRASHRRAVPTGGMGRAGQEDGLRHRRGTELTAGGARCRRRSESQRQERRRLLSRNGARRVACQDEGQDYRRHETAIRHVALLCHRAAIAVPRPERSRSEAIVVLGSCSGPFHQLPLTCSLCHKCFDVDCWLKPAPVERVLQKLSWLTGELRRSRISSKARSRRPVCLKE